jgi:PAS domain S-box-containing protein
MASPDRGGLAIHTPLDECRVAVGVTHAATREQLVEWLDADYVVETVDATTLDAGRIDADALVVDGPALERARAGVDAARSVSAPVYLPVFLVATPREVVSSTVDDTRFTVGVDAVAVPPLLEHEVGDQLRSLLRTRLLSERLATDLDRYLSAMDATGEGITIADVRQPDDPLIYVNDAFGEITGYDPDTVLGRNCRFLQGPATDPGTVAEMRAAIDAGDPVSVRIRNYRADGTPFWNLVRLLPIEEGGEVTHYVGIQRDVTDRVEDEATLQWYRTVVQAAGDPIYTLDADGAFTDVNDAFLAFTGYDRGDLVGTHASMVIDEQDVAACEAIIADLLADPTREAETVEIVVETTAGDRRLCELSIGLLPADDGFRGTVGVVRDITEPKGREQRLAVLERVLRHNLKNKMSVVLGRTDALADTDGLDAEAREHVTAIANVAETLLGISQEAREFRDVITLKENEPRTCDVVAIVADIVDNKRHAFPDTRIALDAPESALVSTRGRLHVAVDELIENAIDHSDRDRPTVEVTVRIADDAVTVAVADDGPGIPAMERDVIAASTERPLEHGSGLGLWLVTWTVEQSGGRIDIRDNEPRGTVVTLTLPRADE